MLSFLIAHSLVFFALRGDSDKFSLLFANAVNIKKERQIFTVTIVENCDYIETATRAKEKSPIY